MKDYEFFGKPKGESYLNEILADCLMYITGEGYVSYLPKRYEDNWALYEFFRRVLLIIREKTLKELKKWRD